METIFDDGCDYWCPDSADATRRRLVSLAGGPDTRDSQDQSRRMTGVGTWRTRGFSCLGRSDVLILWGLACPGANHERLKVSRAAAPR